MELDILMKIKEDSLKYEYLQNNSLWFKKLNRNPDNLKKFLDEYKEYNRSKKINKVSNSIDNIELISSVLNVLK